MGDPEFPSRALIDCDQVEPVDVPWPAEPDAPEIRYLGDCPLLLSANSFERGTESVASPSLHL